MDGKYWARVLARAALLFNFAIEGAELWTEEEKFEEVKRNVKREMVAGWCRFWDDESDDARKVNKDPSICKKDNVPDS